MEIQCQSAGFFSMHSGLKGPSERMRRPGSQVRMGVVNNSFRFHQNNPKTTKGTAIACPSPSSELLGTQARNIHFNSELDLIKPKVELPRNWKSASQAAKRTR